METMNRTPRVLLVENDKRVRDTYEYLLQFWGYSPILASGKGKALYRNAIKKSNQFHCILALIDLRLLDDSDPEDNSGLRLAEELNPTRSIILTGYPNQNILRDLLENHRDIPFLTKSDAPERIKKTLDTEAGKVCAVMRGLVIDPSDLTENLMQTAFGSLIEKYPDQVSDILAQLFPRASKLRIERLDSNSNPTSDVPRPGSIILKVYEEDFEPVVVKLARAKKIAIEVERYERFIAGRVSRSLTAKLERHAELWDIGGALYSYIGDFDVVPFSQYYEDHSMEDIRECLDSFFTISWGRHYEKCQKLKNISLFDLYSEVWGDWYGKNVKNFSTTGVWPEEGYAGSPGIPNPIPWFKNRIAESPGANLSMVETTLRAVTHGDLHGDNLLIDSRKNTWVIDFERTGEGHALQDFVELEADIINRLPSRLLGSKPYYDMCLVIAGQTEIKALDENEIENPVPEIRKALLTVSILRSLAQKCTGISDARQYLLGLLFNMLFRATINNEESYQRRQRQVLLLAGIFCHRLDHWNEPWPPKEWKQISHM